MAKIPGIIQQDSQLKGPAQQQRADADTLVPGWRQVDSSYRSAGESQQSVYQGEEAAALAQQRAALASGKIGESIGELADPIEKRYKQMEFSDAQLQATNTRAQWTQHLITTLKNATAEQIKDPEFVDKFIQSFDDGTGGISDNYNTPEARAQITHALAETRAELGTHMMTVMGEKVGQLAVQNVKSALLNRTNVAAANPSFAQGQIKGMEADNANLVAMHQMDPIHLEQLNREGGEAIVKAMFNGMSQSNPEYVAKQLTLSPEARDAAFQGLVGKYTSGEITEKARTEAMAEQHKREILARIAKEDTDKQNGKQADAWNIKQMQDIWDPNADHTKIGDKLRTFNFNDLPGMKPGQVEMLFNINAHLAQMQSEPKADHALASSIVNDIIDEKPNAYQSMRDIPADVRLKIGQVGMTRVQEYLDGRGTESGRASNALLKTLERAGDSLAFKMPLSEKVNSDKRDEYLTALYNALEEGHANHISTKSMVSRFMPDGVTPNKNYIGGIIENFRETIQDRTKRLMAADTGTRQPVGATEMPAPRIPAFMITSQKLQDAANLADAHANELTRLAATAEGQKALSSVTGESLTNGVIEGVFGPVAPGFGETVEHFNVRKATWEKEQEKTKPAVVAKARATAERRKEDLK